MAQAKKASSSARTRAARAATAKRKQRQQQQLLIIGGGIVAAVVVVIAVIILTNQGADVAQLNDPKFAAYQGIPYVENSENNREIERASDVEESVTRGTLEESGIPYIGAFDAPLIIADFSDFSCPHCGTFAEGAAEDLVQNFVRAGDVRFEYYPMTFVGGERSRVAAQAAICAEEQGAFWEYHKELFNIREVEGAQSFDKGRMEELANQMGLDDGQLSDCMNGSTWRRPLAAAQELANANGVTGTPTLLYRFNRPGATWNRLNADPNNYGSVEGEIRRLLAQVQS